MIHASDIRQELIFTTSRSGGAGGQHVNKVSSKVTLRWDVLNSRMISTENKEHLLAKWKNRLTDGGELVLYSQESRSQAQNKENVIGKLEKLLVSAFTIRRVRKATKPSKTSVQKRLTSKKYRSEKKAWRKKP